MEYNYTTTEVVTVKHDEYRDLLTQSANYAMLKDVIKAGIQLDYREELTIAQTTIDVVIKYILGGAYDATREALKAKED